MRDYYKQFYANKMDNLEEMDKFLEKHNLLRLNQEEIEKMNRPITSTEILKLVELINEFGKVVGYKINARNLLHSYTLMMENLKEKLRKHSH